MKVKSKKILISGVLVIGIAAGGIVAALNQPQHTGADSSPLTQEVDRQGQELANHESRITNTENDVKALQNNTNTPPATHVSVPADNTTQTVVSTPTVTQQAAPITVTSSKFSGSTTSGVCELTYSDGSTNQVTATITPVQVDPMTLAYNNNCQSFIGS